MRGQEEQSRAYLEKAADLYPLDPQPLLSLGKMYFAQRQAYNAFCRLDVALKLNRNVDLDLSSDTDKTWIPLKLKAAMWDARVLAGRCAVICAEEEASRGQTERPFARTFLPEAIERIQMALDVAPKDERLVGLLMRAKELLRDALNMPIA